MVEEYIFNPQTLSKLRWTSIDSHIHAIELKTVHNLILTSYLYDFLGVIYGVPHISYYN